MASVSASNRGRVSRGRDFFLKLKMNQFSSYFNVRNDLSLRKFDYSLNPGTRDMHLTPPTMVQGLCSTR